MDRKKMKTLKEMCVKCIGINLELFNSAYLKTLNSARPQDAVLRRNLGFLRKKFSPYFLEMLTQLGENFLERKYYDFFINEYLTTLDTSIFHPEDWEDAINILTRIGKCFEEVRVHGNPDFHTYIVALKNEGKELPHYMRDFINKVLPEMPNLKVLELCFCSSHCSETIRIISENCFLLEDVWLHCDCCLDNILKNLSTENHSYKINLRRIASYDYSMNRRDDRIACLLQRMPSLEAIDCLSLHNVIHKLHLEDLLNNSLDTAQKYDLKELYLSGSEQSDLEFEQTLQIVVSLCPNARQVMACKIKNEESLQILTKLEHLTDLCIDSSNSNEFTKLLDVSEFLVSCSKELRNLKMFRCKLSVPVLAKACRKLKSLHLMCCQFIAITTNPRFRTLYPVYGLVKLTIDQCTYRSIVGRSSCSLTQNTCRVDPEGLSLLFESCPNLEELIFRTVEFSGTCCRSIWPDISIDNILKEYCGKARKLQTIKFFYCNFNCQVSHLLKHIVKTYVSLKMLVVINSGKREKEELKQISRFTNPSLDIECDFFDDPGDF